MSMQVPAFLQALAKGRNLALEGQQGLGGGNPVPFLSIKSQQFAAVDVQGGRIAVGKIDPKGQYVDVVVVDLNPHVSKRYYNTSFDPQATDYLPPACWSDNGVGPSSQAAEPQSPTCVSCEHNKWGSKISASGSEIKACSDRKKVGVLVGDLEAVFMLDIPPASLKNWKNVCQLVATHGANLNMMNLRIRFDPSVQGVLIFEPTGWIDQATAEHILSLDDAKLATITGRNDTPKQGALPAPAAPVAQIASKAPEPFIPPAPAQPAPQGFMSAPAEAPQPRKRRTKAEIEADNAKLAGQTAPAPSVVTSPPPFLGAAPAVATPPAERFGMQAAPVVSDAGLDALIADAMSLPTG